MTDFTDWKSNGLSRWSLPVFLRKSCINWASARENLSLGFPPKWVSNKSPQLQRLARKLKFHLKQVYILYFPKSEWQRRWSDCADAQAGLRLCCSQTTEDRLSHVEAKLKAGHHWSTSETPFKWLMTAKNWMLARQLCVFTNKGRGRVRVTIPKETYSFVIFQSLGLDPLFSLIYCNGIIILESYWVNLSKLFFLISIFF